MTEPNVQTRERSPAQKTPPPESNETSHRIDVAADFVYDSENKSYNQISRLWRKNTKTPYMYRYTGDAREFIYVSGSAEDKPSASLVERQALSQCSEVVGISLLAHLLTTLVGTTVVIWFLNICGLDIRLDFLTLRMSGDPWLVTMVRCLLSVVRYALPAALLVRFCRIPRGIVFPTQPGGLPEVIFAAGCAMCIAAIYALTAVESGVETAQRIFAEQGSGAIAAYGIFDMTFGTLLAEMYLRGTVLPLLRQFGDGFAVLITAMAAFLFPNELPDRIAELMLGLACGYVMLRGGSIWKCVILRGIYSILSYARLILVYSNRVLPLWQYALLLLSIGMLSVAFAARMRRGKMLLNNRHTQVPDTEKVVLITQNVATFSWIAVSALIALLQIFYTF